MYPVGHSMEGGRIGSSAIGSSTTGFSLPESLPFFLSLPPPPQAKRSVKKIVKRKNTTGFCFKKHKIPHAP